MTFSPYGKLIVIPLCSWVGFHPIWNPPKPRGFDGLAYCSIEILGWFCWMFCRYSTVACCQPSKFYHAKFLNNSWPRNPRQPVWNGGLVKQTFPKNYVESSNWNNQTATFFATFLAINSLIPNHYHWWLNRQVCSSRTDSWSFWALGNFWWLVVSFGSF